MDSNNMYQNQQTGGPDPDQSTNYGDGAYQSSQNMNYGDGAYQSSQNTNYGDNAYQDNNAYTQSSYQNSNYQPYQYNNNSSYSNSYSQPQMDLEEPVKMSEWLITMLIMLIPCVNIVMMFVWAFSKNEKKSKSNYFKACLIWVAIVFVLYIIMIVAIAVMGVSLAGNYKYY